MEVPWEPFGPRHRLVSTRGESRGDNRIQPSHAHALVVATALVAGLALLKLGDGLAGRVLLGLSFADIGLWMLAGASSSVVHHDPVAAVVVASVLAVSSVAGLIGVVGDSGDRTSGQGPAMVGAAAVAVLVVGLVASLIPARHSTSAPPGELSLSVRDTSYSTRRLATAAGQVSIRVTNHDLFWHTFTVAGKGVDLKVPFGATRRVSFSAQPGIYQFHCRIPSHHRSRMKGTITLR